MAKLEEINLLKQYKYTSHMHLARVLLDIKEQASKAFDYSIK